MKRKSSPSLAALPCEADQPESGLGFTVWVHLAASGRAAEALLFRAGLDRYLERQGLARSMNPLHMLVWSPQRSLSVVDQIDLLAWLTQDQRAVAVEIGDLQTHMFLPAGRDRVRHLPAHLGDQRLFSLICLYRAGRIRATQVIQLLGGYRPVVTLH